MSTKLKYFEDSNLCKDSAVIVTVGSDENGHYLVLDQTIFYPQGGGQPSDCETIKVDNVAIAVHQIKNINDEVRHYIDTKGNHLVGTRASCEIDLEKKLLQARLHTSGHLISNVIERLYPLWQAIKGHHFPEQCYVELSANTLSPIIISIESVQQELESFIEKDHIIFQKQIAGSQLEEICPNLPYALPVDQQVRLIRIGELPFSPCGGTHLNSLKELEGLEITKHRVKGKSMKIYYSIRRSL